MVGAGEMGHGIAEVLALAGLRVSLIDVKQEILDRAMSRIADSLRHLASRGKISQDQVDQVLSRISTHTSIAEGARGADIAVEAVPERIDVKSQVLRELELALSPDAVISTNTSSIMISELSRFLSRRDRFLGTHFFNPPVVMKLVEVVKGPETSDAVVDAVVELLRSAGKVPIRVRDSVGFVVNRIEGPELLFFCLLLDRGIVKPPEVDAFFRSQGLPMGPYELMDYVGLDVVNDLLKYYSEKLSPDYGKCRTIGELVSKGYLGMKAGRGFYEWEGGRAKVDLSRQTDRVSLLDVMLLEVNEAVKLIEEGVASPDDIETAVKLGLNRPFGPITVAKTLTSSEARERLEALAREFGCEVFAPAKSIREGRLRDAVEGRLGPPPAAQPPTPSQQAPAAPAAQPYGEYKYLRVTKVGERILRIALNRPRLNLMSPDLLDELGSALDRVRDDPEVFVVLVTGEGNVFSAGADLSVYVADPVQFLEFSRKGERVLRKLVELPKVTIAEIKGYALGGGLELALSCDIRLATPDSTLGFPEVTLGILPGWGGTQRLPRLIGMSRAMELILTGRRISGKEAHEIGLVASLLGQDPDGEALKYAESIATGSAPIAARFAKMLVNKASEVPEDVGLEMESTAFGILFSTQDMKEGVSALLQKRKPVFRGK
ncbi:MAG: 3-hydroxyacyl-CoA dehydrogenase NAD-binding domain-containing protein [Conexivisphaera sp.]